LRILAAFGGHHLDYCDPDFFPIQFQPEIKSAHEALPRMKADPRALRAILTHEHLPLRGTLTDPQLLVAYQDFKQMAFVRLHPDGGDYLFSLFLATETVKGTITRSGGIHVTERTPNDYGCPICLAKGTLIATPAGLVAVQDVRVGIAVWTTDRSGRRVRGTVLRVGRSPVPPTHEVVRLTLANGHTVLASPGHPTPDGRLVGDLRPGDTLDGTRVTSAVLIPYGGRFTYDLLPSGPTGTYFANGILLGSTLASR